MRPRATQGSAQPRPDLTGQILDEWLEGLAAHTAPGAGVTRLVYDDAWCRAHQWLAGKARELGLAATADAAGNLLFHDPGLAPGDPRPALFVGSHFDTVVNGGRYDGAYGAVSGLMLAAEPRHPGDLAVIGFATCEEEESRFHAAFMGARSLLGEASDDELDRATDGDGVTWRAALEAARARGCAAPLGVGPRPFQPPFRPALMLELHIEQGPVLEAEKLSLGLVERIAGYRRLGLAIEGEASMSSSSRPPAVRP